MKQYTRPATRALELRMERMTATSDGNRYPINGSGTDAEPQTNRKDGGWGGTPWAGGGEHL